jgi:hypothetical protein
MLRCLQNLKCCKSKPKKEIGFPEVYVLELKDNKFYVGKSSDKEVRIKRHTNGYGSAWTNKYKPINELSPVTNPQQSFWELWETLELMKKYGINNVRGSMFTSPYPLLREDKIMAAQLYCELYDLCRKCGGSGHFITHCKGETNADWVENFGGVLDSKQTNIKRLCLECNITITSSPSNHRYCRDCYYHDNNSSR